MQLDQVQLVDVDQFRLRLPPVIGLKVVRQDRDEVLGDDDVELDGVSAALRRLSREENVIQVLELLGSKAAASATDSFLLYVFGTCASATCNTRQMNITYLSHLSDRTQVPKLLSSIGPPYGGRL